MFYSQYILARKGPLGKIWLAAHFEKKLTKSQVFSTDITESVKNIISPSIPLALRVSGHLMLGIVRIYSDKVKYLSSDCRDAMTKISLAFKAPIRSEVDQQPVAPSRIDDSNYATLPIESDLSSTKVYSAERRIAAKYSSGKIDDSEVSLFYTVGEIELLRHEDLRPSLPSERVSILPDSGRRSYESMRKYEEELPAFDLQMGENLFAEPRFDSFTQFGLEDSGAMPDFVPTLPEPEVSQFEFPAAAAPAAIAPQPAARAKKRKVEISDKIEIPDALWKSRLKDVHAILRRPKDAELEFRTVPVPEEEVLEEPLVNLSGARGLCIELQEVVDICTSGFDHVLFPFQRTAEFRALREPSVAAPEVTRLAPPEEVREVEPSIISAAESRRATLEPSMEMDYGDIGGFEPQFGAMESSFEIQQAMEERKDEHPLSRVIEQRLSGKMEEPSRVSEVEPPLEVRSERTNMVLSIIQQELDVQPSIPMDHFCSGCSKSVAARFFLELLQLKTWNKIQLEQSGPYEPITITRP